MLIVKNPKQVIAGTTYPWSEYGMELEKLVKSNDAIAGVNGGLYYSYGKGENERIIDPAEMFLFQDGWYCAAFCEMKKELSSYGSSFSVCISLSGLSAMQKQY